PPLVLYTLSLHDALPISSSKIWVMPSFSPRIPLKSATPVHLQLDLDVDAGRELEPLELLHRLGRGVVDVDEPLVREHLEVLPRRSEEHTSELQSRGHLVC